MPVTTDFAGTETLAETKSRLGTLLTAYGYDSSGYSTWGDARTDLNSALTAIEETTISDGELASSFRSKLNALNAWSDYPAGGKVPNLVFDFEDEYYRANDTETTFGDSITFSRASSATYVDSDGVLQTAASGVPRIGHHVWNGSAWVNEGLLHESEARTNLLTYSEMVNGVGWTEAVATATNLTDDALGVWGGVSIASNGVKFHRLSASDTIAVTTGDILTFRVWVKAGTSGSLRVNFRDPATNNQSNIVGAFGSLSLFNDSAGTITSVEEEDWGGGIVAVSGAITVNFTGDLEFGVGPDSNVSGETVIAYAAQLEIGSTPSSYIPTSGSAVTRAAETLTIPAAKLPWPTPNVIGPELVTNGTFDTDISGWTDDSSAGGSIAWNASGYLDLIYTIGVVRASQSISLTAGKVYVVSFEVIAAPVSSGLYIDGGVVGNFALLGTGTHTVYYTAETSGGVTMQARVFAAGTVSIDNISVREINPLAVSIQMDGRITYADEGVSGQQKFFQWVKDGSNFIQSVIDTDVGTGRVRTQQAASGVFDGATVSSNHLTPDILVPFSSASRHGSTFIQLAVDGTSGNENTTPVALPDLSTTDLSLGHDYMGTIRTFRMWDQDIGDSGIEEASA